MQQMGVHSKVASVCHFSIFIVNKTKLPEIYIQKEILEELQKLDNPFVN